MKVMKYKKLWNLGLAIMTAGSLTWGISSRLYRHHQFKKLCKENPFLSEINKDYRKIKWSLCRLNDAKSDLENLTWDYRAGNEVVEKVKNDFLTYKSNQLLELENRIDSGWCIGCGIGITMYCALAYSLQSAFR